MSVMPKYVLLGAALGIASLGNVARPAPADPAALQVQNLDTALVESMHAGPRVASTERYSKLKPVIEQVFDLPLMARVSIGPAWTKFSPDEQKAAIAAFSRLTISSYVHNFREFGGEKFELDDHVASRDADKIVQTKIIPAHDAPAAVTYRLRSSGGTWKIVDVVYDGISELTMHRSDFSSAIAGGGAPALIAHLNKLSDALMQP